MKNFIHRTGTIQNSSGFTIVELLIATTVFSVILLLCTAGLIQVGRMYYKGITTSQTQEAARSIMDEISRNIQFGGGDVVPASGSAAAVKDFFCIGNRRYSFLIGQQLSDSPAAGSNQKPNVLIVEENAPCDGTKADAMAASVAATTVPYERELLRPNMRLAKLEVKCASGTVDCPEKLYQVTVRVVYGDDDLLVQPPAANAYEACGSFRAGAQFCAVSELSTVVKKRVK